MREFRILTCCRGVGPWPGPRTRSPAAVRQGAPAPPGGVTFSRTVMGVQPCNLMVVQPDGAWSLARPKSKEPCRRPGGPEAP